MGGRPCGQPAPSRPTMQPCHAALPCSACMPRHLMHSTPRGPQRCLQATRGTGRGGLPQLPHPVHARDCLLLYRRLQRRLQQKHVVGAHLHGCAALACMWAVIQALRFHAAHSAGQGMAGRQGLTRPAGGCVANGAGQVQGPAPVTTAPASALPLPRGGSAETPGPPRRHGTRQQHGAPGRGREGCTERGTAEGGTTLGRAVAGVEAVTGTQTGAPMQVVEAALRAGAPVLSPLAPPPKASTTALRPQPAAQTKRQLPAAPLFRLHSTTAQPSRHAPPCAPRSAARSECRWSAAPAPPA